VRSLVVHSRPGHTITLITATGRTPIMGPAVTASGMVTPGYLPVSYEQQLPRYRLGSARKIYFGEGLRVMATRATSG
jgi:hypothetical protein